MEKQYTPRKRRLVHAPAGPVMMAFVEGVWIPLRTEQLGRASLFVLSKVYIRPRTVFMLHIHLSPQAAPLRVLGSSSFIERTWDGYGVGVELSSLSADDERRWRYFLAQFPALGESTAGSWANLRPVQPTRQSAVVVVGQALVERTITALRNSSVEVESAPSLDRALERAASGGVRMVVVDLAGIGGLDPQLRQAMSRTGSRVSWVLLTNRDDAATFDSALLAGAAMVAGRQCGQSLLVTRLLRLFHQDIFTDSDVQKPIGKRSLRQSAAPL